MDTLKTVIADVDITTVIKAKHDRIIVVRDATPDKIVGLDIPDANKKLFKQNTGTVLSVGTRCKEVKARMDIMFGKSAGTEVTINSRTLVIMHEEDAMIDLATQVPFHNKVLLRADPMPKEIGSIIIPDNVNDQPQSGTVMARGPACCETEVGERVLMGKYAGSIVTLGGQEYIVLREDDLFARI